MEPRFKQQAWYQCDVKETGKVAGGCERGVVAVWKHTKLIAGSKPEIDDDYVTLVCHRAMRRHSSGIVRHFCLRHFWPGFCFDRCLPVCL